ncbi:MAG TPA: ribosome recycling factor [Spirochaetia bacterium]|nr:MAG: ribosome recycling factor [Spirochaetes bacterium GWE1_32_154]OHD46491.1 MAG: ribosome recycling factor [Spirochaetes bacterium GWE2_31_10]HBD93386.1 ribosome recycling factor [Spirochaetia bacterium]HBI37077.1 ribosome recycling factor [Spirochaetia bacterium]
MIDDVKNKFNEKALKSIDAFLDGLKKIRTGRASASVFDNVTVDYYGQQTPLNQVANITVPEARMILIQPWEKNMISPIEKSILKAELGFNPSNDGNVIRVNIAPLTKETRLELVKEAKQQAEQAKVIIRNLRRDSNELLKKLLKDHQITEDQEKKGLEDSQKLTDKYIVDITKLFEKKEKEILEI